MATAKKTITQTAWAKVAENVTSGLITRTPWDNSGSFRFYCTTRATGDTAPTDTDKTDGNLSFELFGDSNFETISSSAAIDIYIIAETNCADITSSSLRVDT